MAQRTIRGNTYVLCRELDRLKDGEVSQIKLNPRDFKNSLHQIKEKLADKKLALVFDNKMLIESTCTCLVRKKATNWPGVFIKIFIHVLRGSTIHNNNINHALFNILISSLHNRQQFCLF